MVCCVGAHAGHLLLMLKELVPACRKVVQTPAVRTMGKVVILSHIERVLIALAVARMVTDGLHPNQPTISQHVSVNLPSALVAGSDHAELDSLCWHSIACSEAHSERLVDNPGALQSVLRVRG